MLQADRGAVSPDEAKALVTELWRRTDSGKSFRAALEDRDWILARGDRRDFVVVDPQGGTHSLARRVEGAKAKDIRARMADVDPELLPSVTEARAEQRERKTHQPVASLEPSPPAPSALPNPSPTAEPNSSRSHAAIQIDHAAAERDAQRTAALRELEQAAKADNKTLRNQPAVPSAERAFAEAAREQAQDVRNERRDEKFKATQETWRSSVDERSPDKVKPVEKGLQVVDSATGFVMGLGEFMLDFFSGSSPQRQPDPNDPATRSRQQVERLIASRRAEGAIENIQRDIEAGRHLKSEDIKSLTREHQEQIKSHGDNYVRQMVEEARQRDERHWRNDGREREW
jgi:hypothetical protein